MAEEAKTETTLRDTIEQAVEEHVPTTPAPEASPSPAGAAAAATEPSAATPERPRDEKGRFVETKEEKAAAAAKAAVAAPQVAAAAAPVKAHPKVPSSWKKDYHEHWGKLDPSLADYILQREGEYAKGVSTYKTEWETAKPLLEALQPYSGDIKSLGLQPAQFVSNLAQAHQSLSRGSLEQKLSMFMKLAQDYQVPLQNLFVQGQDGKFYFNPQVQPHQPQQQRQSAPQQDVAKLVRDEIAGVMSQQQISQFAEEKDGQGNPVHPHFEAVREDMALLLDAGKAQDLKDAYRKALRMNDELFAAEQEAKKRADEAARQEAQKKAVAAAKANAVSTKTATPSQAAGGAKPKGLRSTIEAAFEDVVPSRV